MLFILPVLLEYNVRPRLEGFANSDSFNPHNSLTKYMLLSSPSPLSKEETEAQEVKCYVQGM